MKFYHAPGPDSISSVNRFEAEEVEDYDIPQEGAGGMYFRSGSSAAGIFQIGQSQMELPNSYPSSSSILGSRSDDDYLDYDSFILSTPASRPTYLPETIVTSTSRPTLAELHLDGFTWIESLLDASAENILLQTNDTSAVVLKLSKDSVAPKEASDAECASAVEGGAGVCVYLSRCDAAKTITVDVFKTTYCTVSGGYAGVCCPQKKVDLTH